MNKFNYKYLTPFKWFVLENFPFIEADFDALTEWQLFCKIGKEINKIIDSQNVVGTQMENVTNAFIELQNYVNNYFDNLDVQEEINNKLNEMTEDGTLQNIIISYLQMKAILTFENIEELKNAENLIENTIAETLGFYNINDKGNAKYKIVNNENLEVDNITIISLNNYPNLVAKLIITNNEINVNQFGAKPNSLEDSSLNIQKALNFANENNIGLINFFDGKYLINNEIDLSNMENLILQGTGKTLLEKPILYNTTNIFFGDYAKNISFKDIKFNGNRPDNFGYVWPHQMNACIICRYGINVNIENCIFENFWYGVCTATSKNSCNSKIDKCIFNNCNSDIDLYGKPLISITNISSNNCTGNSIQIEPSEADVNETVFNYLDEENINSISVNNIIQNCSITNCKGIAINIHSGSINIIITNNMIANCNNGISCYHMNSKNIVISNNTILNITGERVNDNARPNYNDGCGITLSANIFGAIVTNNIINRARLGIFISGSTSQSIYAENYIISNNSIQYCKTSGISLLASKNCQISNNYLYNNARGLENGLTYYKNSGICLQNCEQINCNSNYCNDTSELDTRQRACVYIDSTSSNITVSNCTGINMVENPVNNDARTGNRYADGSKVYTSPFTAITNVQ